MRRVLFPLPTLALASLALLPPASAHDQAKGPNGGPVVEVAGHHIEFVPSASEITFYLTGEKDAPLDSAGAKAKAIVQSDGKNAQLDLAPVAPNKLVGKIAAPLKPGAKVAVSGALADGHSLQSRFVAP